MLNWTFVGLKKEINQPKIGENFGDLFNPALIKFDQSSQLGS